MKFLRREVLWLACCCSIWAGLHGAFAPRAAAQSRLSSEIEAVINAPRYKHSHWGILVVDAESGETLYEQDADKLFAPASVTKLFSVAAALDALGSDFRFETPVYRRGEVDASGVLQGDLILVASGDLSLGGRTTEAGQIAFVDNDHTYANGSDKGALTPVDPLSGLNDLARQVQAAGIKRVRGDVLIDDRLFEKGSGTGSGPQRLTPIMINDNLVDFTITAAEPGQPARLDWRPRSAALQVDGRIETVADKDPISITIRAYSDRRVVVSGRIPAGRPPLVRVYEVEDANSWARALFIEALERAGVTVDASLLADHPAEARLPGAADYAQLARVARHVSPPFSESARLILKVSHNLQASTLPLLVAAKSGKRTLAEGLRLQHDFLARHGVDVETISFGGGAGGSIADSVTPRATVQLLLAMRQRPDFEIYRAALPVLRVDGTLSEAVPPESPAKGKVYAKTGTFFWENTMNGRYLLTSKALAGYMKTSRNRELAFAMFVNRAHIDKAQDTAVAGKTLGQLCELIYAAQ
jgi:D-alanyl-D-alanine carboxypeptidase/D-alanyl-D-alanine-endopeptidase (penicillin-binding protein 4)